MKVNKHLHMNMRPSIQWFGSFRAQIMRVWSRTNLEGRCFAWTGFTVRLNNPEEGIFGFLHAGEYANWTAELDGMWRAIVWKNCY